MREVNKELSLEEKAAAQTFFDRIGEVDTWNLRSLIGVVDAHADEYFGSEEPDQSHNYFAHGEAFFAVYGIGGNVTKKGERPDVDILVVTNMRYSEGFLEGYDDRMDDPHETGIEPLWIRMNQVLRAEMEVKKEGDLPCNYNLSRTKGKCLIRLTPNQGGRRMDVVYAKSMADHGESGDLPRPGETWEPIDYSTTHFDSEADFVAKDVSAEGKPLPKVLLYRASTKDIQVPEMF